MKYKGEYPIKDEHRRFYVMYPVKKDGKWYCADVHLPSGYNIPVARIGFDTEDECQKACNVHNNYHGFTEDIADDIIGKSMGLTEDDKAYTCSECNRLTELLELKMFDGYCEYCYEELQS